MKKKAEKEMTRKINKVKFNYTSIRKRQFDALKKDSSIRLDLVDFYFSLRFMKLLLWTFEGYLDVELKKVLFHLREAEWSIETHLRTKYKDSYKDDYFKGKEREYEIREYNFKEVLEMIADFEYMKEMAFGLENGD